jgi:hypothetical protein
MAKNPSSAATTNLNSASASETAGLVGAATPETGASATAAPVAPTTTAPDNRFIMVTKTDGTVVKRSEYIKELWQVHKWTRGVIAKHLTELSGKKVPYQIVFAATKKLPGGPDKPATPAPTDAPAPQAQG